MSIKITQHKLTENALIFGSLTKAQTGNICYDIMQQDNCFNYSSSSSGHKLRYSHFLEITFYWQCIHLSKEVVHMELILQFTVVWF